MSDQTETSCTTQESMTKRLYQDRPEWADVTPDFLDQTDDDVLRISYTESFRDCFGYLRAVIKTGELSERVFEVRNHGPAMQLVISSRGQFN